MRGGVDALNRQKAYLVDLKVTRSSEPAEFSRQAFRMGWHTQAAWMSTACRCNGIEIQEAFILGVESSPPYVVTALAVPYELLMMGQKQIVLWLGRYKQCAESNEWPGYVQSPVPMETPSWLDGGEDDEP